MPGLTRQFTLPLLVLYGLGTTVGVGIYALLADISRTAGLFAPLSFLAAAILAGFTALSYAELGNRYPKAAATSLFIEQGFHSASAAKLVGILLALSAALSTATLANGVVGYAQVFLPLPRWLLIVATLATMTGIALWGIKQSAWFAAITCLLEVGGVIWLISIASTAIELQTVNWSAMVPDRQAVGPVMAGALISFYAYIGFEDMVEVAEEVRDVRRTLPMAILLTLLLTAVLYIALMLTTQLAVGSEFLARSNAPFADIYRHLTDHEPILLTGISLIAMLNGMLIQIIMASRVLYGLAARQQLPAWFARISHGRQVPDNATWLVSGGACILALTGTIAGLATATSALMLAIFALANYGLFRIKGRIEQAQQDASAFTVPRWVPLAGALVSAVFALLAIINALRG
ncbi:MAG: APC family permease [Pseudomonadaceae bacterium]|nr:APC family permease [Pseudomonadaceae bacterium]